MDEVRTVLTDIAKCEDDDRDKIYYSELRDRVAPDLLEMLAFNRVYSPILCAINLEELSEGRPLLSAVVINKTLERPGSGFFKQAQLLGVYDGSDDEAFWRREVERVRKYWRAHIRD